jgi:hypothetical protein
MPAHALLKALPLLCGLVVMELGPPGKPVGEARPGAARPASPRATTALWRFLEPETEALRSYEGARRLIARNDRFGQEAWMTVRTKLDDRGFRYEVTGEGGSDLLRRRVLRAMLEAERDLVARGRSREAALSADNYDIGVATDEGDVVRLTLLPRRPEPFLLDGEARVHPDTGELLSIAGRLAKNPSFWTTRVDVVRTYARIGGVRLPVALDSTAIVRVAGRSVLRMSFEYRSVNGRPVPAGPAA